MSAVVCYKTAFALLLSNSNVQHSVRVWTAVDDISENLCCHVPLDIASSKRVRQAEIHTTGVVRSAQELLFRLATCLCQLYVTL